jgi:hypothetical protein
MNEKHDPEDERLNPEDEEFGLDPVDKALEAMWERDLAMDLAAEESVKRQMAEAEAIEARLAARQKQADAQEMSAQRSLLRHELDNERAAAASSAFGFYLMTGLLIALLIIGGVYFYFRAANNNRIEASTPGTSVTVGEPPAAPAPVIVPAPPPVINVTPPATPSERNANGGTDENKNPDNQDNPDAGDAGSKP